MGDLEIVFKAVADPRSMLRFATKTPKFLQ